jgi:predicted ArsR family transcriptional regulator
VEIPSAAAERNRAWIDAVTQTLGEYGDEELSRLAMANAGKACAEQLLERIVAHHGRSPESVDELIEAMNRRRVEVLGESTLWRREGDRAILTLACCGCDLVQAGLAEPNPVFCLCSAGMFQQVFALFWPGRVHVEIVKALGRGDSRCEFVVHLEP